MVSAPTIGNNDQQCNESEGLPLTPHHRQHEDDVCTKRNEAQHVHERKAWNRDQGGGEEAAQAGSVACRNSGCGAAFTFRHGGEHQRNL
jgi:hypothetical protein